MAQRGFSGMRARWRDAWPLVALLTAGALVCLIVGQRAGHLDVAAYGVAVSVSLFGAGMALRWPRWLSDVLLVIAGALILALLLWLTQGDLKVYLGAMLLGSFLPRLGNWQLVCVASTLVLSLCTWSAFHFPTQGGHWLAVALVGAQYAYLCHRTWMEAERERSYFELDFLIKAMGTNGPIRLNLDVLRAESSTGQRLKDVQHRMADIIHQVYSSIEGVQRAADVLRSGSDELSSRTHSTASGLRDAAMCLEQINVIVQTSAQASMEAKSMAARATELANKGGDQVNKVVLTMGDISQSSGRITDIISVIDGIAFQTNILALNAAVEAARAGEQGRGFAVVAAEVRSLALRSSEAAREIKSLITASINAIDAGVEQVNQTGETMQNIVTSVRKVGEVFDQLSADSHEHAGGIDVVTQSVKELDAVTQQNIAVADNSRGIAAELTQHAQQMSEVLGAFKLGGMMGDQASDSLQPKVVNSRRDEGKAAVSNAAAAPSVAQSAQGVEFF